MLKYHPENTEEKHQENTYQLYIYIQVKQVFYGKSTRSRHENSDILILHRSYSMQLTHVFHRENFKKGEHSFFSKLN